MCISFYDNKQHNICDLVPHDKKGRTIDATYMCNITLMESDIIAIDRKNLIKNESLVSTFGLALPLVTKSDGTHLYYIVSNTWKERMWDKKKKYTSVYHVLMNVFINYIV